MTRSQQEDVQPGAERRFQTASNVRLPQWHKPSQGRRWAQGSRLVRNHFVVVTSLSIASALVWGDGGGVTFAVPQGDLQLDVAWNPAGEVRSTIGLRQIF